MKKILWKLLLAQIRERNKTCNTLPDINKDLHTKIIIIWRMMSQFLNDGVSKFFKNYYTVLKTQVQDVKTTF